MRSARWVSTAILALYCAIMLGGSGVHLWECSDHCGVSACKTQLTEHQHDHCHPHHSHNDEGEQGDSDHPTKPHDPNTCHTCQILAQAQEQPFEFDLPVADAVVPFSCELGNILYTAEEFSLVQPRAPPVA